MGKYIFIIILLVLVILYILYKYHNKNSLKKKIAWCVLELRDLIFNIYYTQSSSSISIEKKYRINDNDEDTIREIIKTYQQELIEYYFKDYEINYYKLSGKAYFFYTLKAFLEKYESETYFNDKKLKTNENKLTPYGISYYKLYYISQMYVINLYETLYKKKLSKDCIAYNKANATKEMLDKGDDL